MCEAFGYFNSVPFMYYDVTSWTHLNCWTRVRVLEHKLTCTGMEAVWGTIKHHEGWVSALWLVRTVWHVCTSEFQACSYLFHVSPKSVLALNQSSATNHVLLCGWNELLSCWPDVKTEEILDIVLLFCKLIKVIW